MAERSATVGIIKSVLKELRKNNQTQQTANNITIAAQTPFDNHQIEWGKDGQSSSHQNTADESEMESLLSQKERK